MKDNFSKRFITLIIAVILVLTALPMAAVAAESKVKVSETAYNVSIKAPLGMLCNSIPLSGKVGTEMYITYTVAEVNSVVAHQQGVIGTFDKDSGYAYNNGGYMYYKNDDVTTMFREGYTYFIKYTIIENGFEYKMAIAKDGEAVYQGLPNVIGDGDGKMKYLGVWFDGGPSDIRLTNVHIYDKNGKDLGADGSNGVSAMPAFTQPWKDADEINHIYSISVEKQFNVRIGNKLRNKTKEMYIEYTVKSTQSKNYQSGLVLNMASLIGGGSTQYPHTNVTYDPQHVEATEISEMLYPGAHYYIKMWDTENPEKGWDYIIQRTYKGKTEWFKFINHKNGIPSPTNYGFSALVYGEGPYHYSTFTLTDLRIYDANHKNLGVQSNVPAQLTHKGEMISYENCDTVYYNAEKNIFVATYSDKTIEITTPDGVTKQGTFSVADSTPGEMTAVFGSEKQKYEFYHSFLKDAQGNQYDALDEYKVSFVTGTEDKIKTQTLSSKNGYKVKKPADPKVKGDTFVSWVTIDGKEFDFDKVQTASVTLYAKWKNRAGKTYVAVEGEKADFNAAPVIAIGLAVVIVAAAVAGSIIIGRRFKR